MIFPDIFGTQNGTHFISGLVDAEQFESNLKKLDSVWNIRESEARLTDTPLFYNWFVRYQSNLIKSKMLLPLRESLGIGRKEFTTNDNEHINSIIKKKVDYKFSELFSAFC